MRALLGDMVGIPLLVLVAMFALTAFAKSPAPVSGQQIAIRTQGTGAGSALVFGAGTGVHLVRVAHAGTPITADLTAGPLRMLSLRALHLDASGVSGGGLRMSATGHTLRLERMGTGVRISTGL